MTDKRDPLLALFDKKERSDADIEADLKAQQGAEEGDEDDHEDDEDGDGEQPGDQDASQQEGDDDQDEDDDDEDLKPNEQGMVPIGAVQKERRRFRERIAKLEGKVDGVAAAASRRTDSQEVEGEEEEFTPPDPTKDPEGYKSYVQGETRQMILQERFNTSERFAVREHGKELVDKAFAWAEKKLASDPQFAASIINSSDPYEDAVTAYKKEQRENRLKDVADEDVEDYKAFRAAKKAGKLDEYLAGQKSKGEKDQKPAGRRQEEDPPRERRSAAKSRREDHRERDEDGDDETPPPSLANDQSARGREDKEPGVGAGQAFKSLFR